MTLPNSIEVMWCVEHQAIWDNCPDAIVIGFVEYNKTAEAEELE